MWCIWYVCIDYCSFFWVSVCLMNSFLMFTVSCRHMVSLYILCFYVNTTRHTVIWDWNSPHSHMTGMIWSFEKKKALNCKRERSSKLSNADEVIPGPPFMATSCHMIRTGDQWSQTHVFPLGAGRQSCGDTAYSGISFSHNVLYYHQNKVTGYQSV